MKKLVAVLFLMFSFMFLSAQETDEEGRLIKYREKNSHRF
jgi:hypothetical protein